MAGLIRDQLWQAWMVGWFSCLMSAFPIAMLLLIPHDGWGRYLPSRVYIDMNDKIKKLKTNVFELQLELELAREIILMKERDSYGSRVNSGPV